MVRLYTASGKSIVPGLVGGVIALAVVVLLVLRPWSSEATSSEEDPGETTTSTSPPTAQPSQSSPASPTPGDRTDPMTQPTGCLGGPERTAASVLDAQAKAGHDSFGAVEVAAAYVRFVGQYPWPPADQLEQARGVIASTATASFSDLAAAYAESGDKIIPAGLEGTGTPFQVTTAGGKWVVDEVTSDRVNVQVATPYVINGAVSSSFWVVGAVLVWENGSWHIESGLPQDADALRDGGTFFTAVCS